jgi:hypothetical protein
MTKYKMVKVGEDFHKWVKNIQAERLRGVDYGKNKPLSSERITTTLFKDFAISKKMEEIEKDIIKLKRPEDLR